VCQKAQYAAQQGAATMSS